MKLLKFSARNFRGINVEFAPNGRDVKIYGCNGAGKTTTEDAFLWLLFGKDSADRKDYDLIPHKPGATEPDVGRGLEPTVEAKLEYSGKTIALKKSYIEDWPKRGALKGQYAGSKTHYFVDGLEVKAGEYNGVVGELIDPALFKLLTNPHYFTDELSWQERRATLVKIAGDLNVEPVPDLITLMDGRPFDKFHALAKQNVKSTQKQLDGIPYAISEAQRMLPTELPDMPDTAALEKQQADLENQIQTLKNNDSANAIRREIAGIETKIAEGRSKYTAAVNTENEKIQNGINRSTDEKQDKTDTYHNVRSQILQLEDETDCLKGLKSNKLAAWHEAHDRAWHGSYICPTCGQKLPPEQIEAARENFNRQKAEDLKKITEDGKAIAKKIEDNQTEITKKNAKLEKLTSEIATLGSRIEKGKSMLKPCVYETQIEYKQLSGRLTDLKNQLANNADTEKNVKLDALMAKLNDVKQQIENAGRIKLQIEQAETQKKHITELENKQKEINTNLGKWEKDVALCEEHVKKSARVLENSPF